MPESVHGNSRIDGWKGIADYLGRDVTTVIRWAKLHGLPVNRAQPGQPRRGVFALRHELDAWMANHEGGVATSGPNGDVGEAAPPFTSESSTADSAPPAKKQQSEDDRLGRISPPIETSTKIRRRRRTAVIFLAGAAGLILIVAGWMWLHSAPLATTPTLSDVSQLTFNALVKRGLQTDGKRLYFGENEHGWLALASESIHGGPIHILWRPNFNVVPIDYSASANALLLTGYEDGDIEPEQRIYIYPLPGGQARRIGKFRAHSAVWSPSGMKIAFAYGRAIYLVNADGRGQRELASFSRVPDMLQWSRNGRQLHFVLYNPATNGSKMFEILFSRGMSTFSIRSVPWPLGVDGGYGWSGTGQPGTFVIRNQGGATDYSLHIVHYGTRWWQRSIRVRTVQSPVPAILNLAMSPSDKRLFALSSSMNEHGVMEYNPNAKRMRYILSNDSVGYIDASRDGRWLTWTRMAGSGLVVAHADGTHKRRYSSTDGFQDIELPRWSPDGKEIAFMGRMPHRPLRDYIMRVSDGAVREASKGNDNQGAPTWSPDGKYLLYGNVLCLRTQTCAIHRIDLANGKVVTLPGSSGLMTARWSPNGKYIVALQPTRHQLMLFNVRTQKWRLLASGINGADLSWTANSKDVYADVMGKNARIVRISVSAGAETTVLDLSQTARFNFRTAHGAVFCPGPHGTLILPWPSPATQIYSFKVKGLEPD